MAATPPTPRAPSRSAMSANVETDRVALVLTLEFMQHPERLAPYFRAAGVPASSTATVHAHYTSNSSEASPSPSRSPRRNPRQPSPGACPWIASRITQTSTDGVEDSAACLRGPRSRARGSSTVAPANGLEGSRSRVTAHCRTVRTARSQTSLTTWADLSSVVRPSIRRRSTEGRDLNTPPTPFEVR